MPTTTPHYTWLYTFTELTPVQCLAERWGLQSRLLVPISAQANGALLIQGGEWSLDKHSLEEDPWPLFILYRGLCPHGSGAEMEKIKDVQASLPSFFIIFLEGDG